MVRYRATISAESTRLPRPVYLHAPEKCDYRVMVEHESVSVLLLTSIFDAPGIDITPRDVRAANASIGATCCWTSA